MEMGSGAWVMTFELGEAKPLKRVCMNISEKLDRKCHTDCDET